MVACQVEGRRKQYLRCGNVWRNIGEIKCTDLEQACDRVPRHEVWRCMKEKGVSEKYVRIVQDMYEGAITQVKSSVGLTA